MIPSPDPLARAAFGGTERELENVHAYRKALRDLRQTHFKSSQEETVQADDHTEDADGGPAPKKGPKGKKGKGKDKTEEDR